MEEETPIEVKIEEKLPAKKDDKKSLIQEAKEAAAEIRKANEEKKELLEREEKLIERKEVLNELGGRSYAGQKEEKKEETPKEYMERVMRGDL